MKIDHVKQQSLTDIVESKIIEAIQEAGLGVGDKLPGELYFSEKLEVSRNIVREAFSRLRMLGILESKKKRGMILREPRITNGLERILKLPILSDKKKCDLFEFRVIIELGLADFVFARKTEKDLEELERIIEKEEAKPESWQINQKTEVAFHTKLYDISGNSVVLNFQSILNEFFTDYSSLKFNPQRFEDKDYVSHRKLINCLRDGTRKEFKELYHKHLQVHIK